MFQASHEKNKQEIEIITAQSNEWNNNSNNLPVSLIHLKLQGQLPQQGTDQGEEVAAQKKIILCSYQSFKVRLSVLEGWSMCLPFSKVPCLPRNCRNFWKWAAGSQVPRMLDWVVRRAEISIQIAKLLNGFLSTGPGVETGEYLMISSLWLPHSWSIFLAVPGTLLHSWLQNGNKWFPLKALSFIGILKIPH